MPVLQRQAKKIELVLRVIVHFALSLNSDGARDFFSTYRYKANNADRMAPSKIAGSKFHSSDVLLGRFSPTFSSDGLSRIEASCEVL